MCVIVSFDEAETAFDDSLARIFDDEWNSDDERREIPIGYSNRNRLLFVSFVQRAHDRIRIISARPADAEERRTHAETSGSNHITKLDDYELKPHYDLDYRKAKPNRFAGRVKFTHGGARPGAGRKAAPEPVERHTITLYKTHADYLRRLDGNLSKAIRKLIATKAK